MRFQLSTLLGLVAGLGFVADPARAQQVYSRPYAWQTLTGVAPFGYRDGAGSAAQFAHPAGLAVSGSGVVYVADTTNCVIRAVSPSGIVTTLAGQPGVNGHQDGTGAGAIFEYPADLVLAPDGNLYVTDGAQVIRRVTLSGVVTTVVGTPWTLGHADGPGATASFWNPGAIACDTAGNLYVGDSSNLTVRKITPAFVVTTFAGSVGVSGSLDGAGTAAQFASVSGLAVDAAGNVFVADGYAQTIREITPAGVVSTIAGTFNQAGTADGTGAAAKFHSPGGIAFAPSGDLVIVDSGSNSIRLMTPAKVVTTFAGTGGTYGSTDGMGAAARFDGPAGVAVDSAGTVYVTDSGNSTLRKISPAGAVSTFAATPAAVASIADGPPASARFTYPWGVARDGAGNVYVTDYFGHTVRKVTASGATTTIAGMANVSGSLDGLGTAAQFNQPAGIVIDSAGALYVADSANHTIRKIAPDGTVTTFAGTAGSSGSADGAGAAARFNNPQGLAIDATNSLYVADTDNHLIRKVTPAGVVSTFAGVAGASGSADGAVATAQFNSPIGLCVDANHVVYVADTSNGTIRKISAGQVSTLAGLAANWGCVDGTGAAARFFGPEGIAVDGAGVVYVADTFNNMIRRVTPGGVVTSAGGVEEVNNEIDGIGSIAQFNLPTGIVSDAAGNLILADSGNNVLRTGTPHFTSLAIVSAPADQAVIAGAPVQIVVSATGTGSLGYQWYFNGTPLANGGNVSGADTPTLVLAHTQTTDTGSYSVLVIDSVGATVSAAAHVSVTAAAPTITSGPQPLTVTAGQPASFSVSATGSPTYQWKFNGVAIAGATGTTLVVSNAQPANAGDYTVTVTNAGGVVTSEPARLTVFVPPPTFTVQPVSASVAPEAAVTFTAAATGAPTFQWYFNGTAIPGATSAAYIIDHAAVGAAGAYSVSATNAGGAVASDVAFLTVVSATGGPSIATQPSSFTAAPGSTLVLTVGASGIAATATAAHRALAASALTYQWFHDGILLRDGNGVTGATAATLVLSGGALRSGNYACLVATPSGAILSQAAAVTIVPTAIPGHLINVSARAAVANDTNVLIAGFVVAGSGADSLPVLVRASGPALGRLGVANTLNDPTVQLYQVASASTLVASNAGWGGVPAIAAAGALVNAFPWTDSASHDAGLTQSVAAGSYSANVASATGGSGVALLEVYDATPTAQVGPTAPRLVNLSARARVAPGDATLIAGFVIGGDTARTVLIRAAGPALAAFGLTGTLGAPKLELYRIAASTPFATNAGWAGDPTVAAIATAVGAFSWGTSPTADAAIVVTLPPGAYTANVSSLTGSPGIALLEIYAVE